MSSHISNVRPKPDKVLTLIADYATNPLFTEVERLALEYADRMTITGKDVDDAFFERLREHFDDDQLVELTMTIAWENSSSKFNRALRIPSLGLWKRGESGERVE